MIFIRFLDYICSVKFYIMSDCNQCIIHKFNSLKKLSKGEIRHLSDHKNETVFNKGEVVFSEGMVLNGIYCVRRGSCKMSRLSSNGKDQIVRFVKQGELLGYRSVMSDEPATLTVTAINEMHACFIPKDEIFDIINENSEFARDFFRVVCEDLKEANIALTDMAQKTVRERLAKTLLFLDETFGEDEEGNFAVALSREEIANVIGTATESAIRLLSEFKKEGLIGLSGKKIKILDEKKIERIALGF